MSRCILQNVQRARASLGDLRMFGLEKTRRPPRGLPVPKGDCRKAGEGLCVGGVGIGQGGVALN